MARLIIFDESVRAVDLPDHAVIVGRSRKADIPIHDRLLSRKHLTISPLSEEAAEGAPPEAPVSLFRLVDLKSANGTFVNGERVETWDLEFDDVIELGSTVMVLLDTDTWHRGEGLPPLRNPLKAQELVQRLRQQATAKDRGQAQPWGADLSGSSLRARGTLENRPMTVSPVEAEFVEWAEGALEGSEVLQSLLADLVERRIAELLLQEAPELRMRLETVFARIMEAGPTLTDREHLRAAVRRVLDEALGSVVPPEEAATEDTPAGTSEGSEEP